MKRKIQQGKRQKSKLRTNIVVIVACLSLFVTLTAGLLLFINLNNNIKSRASSTGLGGGGNDLGNGEIISEFNWENDPVTVATLGPDAMIASKDAHSKPGGQLSTNGLSAGANGNNINIEISEAEIFKQDGIDISIDYRRNELTGDFFSFGKDFNFGMEDGFITIRFCVENKNGKTEIIKSVTTYEIPIDPVYRTYRFIYTPTSGRAEIFVNNLIVWQHSLEKNTPLSWKKTGSVIIGREMNGGGKDMAIMDNLIVRNTVAVSPLTESLLNFMLEAKDGGVRLHWSTSANEKSDFFTIERSVNGLNFTNIFNVNAKPDSSQEDVEYIYSDKTAVSSPIVYYRLRQTFKNGKFVTHPLSAIRFKSDKSFSIERINPSPFEKSCDISFYLPKSGRVWLQITDSKGSIVKTSSFEAPQGKNVHVLRDDLNLQSGTYTLSMIFDNKKMSTKLVKA